jgi:hypothetical protein
LAQADVVEDLQVDGQRMSAVGAHLGAMAIWSAHLLKVDVYNLDNTQHFTWKSILAK